MLVGVTAVVLHFAVMLLRSKFESDMNSSAGDADETDLRGFCSRLRHECSFFHKKCSFLGGVFLGFSCAEWVT